MTSVADLAKDALIEIGVIAPNEPLTADDGNQIMRVLNRMIGQWNIEDLMIYTLDRQIFTLTANQQSYTMGPGGNFNVARPVRIQMASVLNTNATPNNEIPIDILTDEEWRGIGVKGTTATFPTKLWRTGNVPLDTLWLWPVPQDTTYQLILYTWGQTTAFTDINAVVYFPPGYEEALVTNLAVRLASSYGRPVDQVLFARAQQAKSLVEGINLEPLFTTVDAALLGNGGTNRAISSFGYLVDRT